MVAFLGQANNQNTNPVLWGTASPPTTEGRLIWPLTYQVIGPLMSTGPQAINLSQVAMSTIESILIDNSGNVNPLTVLISPTQQSITVKPQTYQIAPFLCPGGAFTINFSFNAAPPVSANINILLMNYQNYPQEWSAAVPANVSILPGYTFGTKNAINLALTGAFALAIAGNTRRAALTVTYGDNAMAAAGAAELSLDLAGTQILSVIGAYVSTGFGFYGNNGVWQGPLYARVFNPASGGAPVLQGIEFVY